MASRSWGFPGFCGILLEKLGFLEDFGLFSLRFTNHGCRPWFQDISKCDVGFPEMLRIADFTHGSWFLTFFAVYCFRPFSSVVCRFVCGTRLLALQGAIKTV